MPEDGSDIELARDLVARLAPGELPYFPTILVQFESIPNPSKAIRSGGDVAGGIGPIELVTLLTPTVLLAAQAAVRCMAEEFGKGVGKEASAIVMERIHNLMHRPAAGEQLDAALGARIRQTVLDVALAAKLPETQALELADATVQRLSGT